LALDPAKSIYQYNCRNWTRQNGLPVNGISAMTQTRDGYLWLGTQKGLVVFDGVQFNLISLPNQHQFWNQTISSLTTSKDGGLWFGINGGSFGYYDGRENFSSIESNKWVTPQMNVQQVHEASDGSLWVGAYSGAARFIKGRTNDTIVNEQLWNVTAIYEDSRHRIWLGTTEQGLYYWEGGKFILFPDATLKKETIFAVVIDTVGRLWVGTQWGLRCYDSDFKPKEILPFTTEVRALLVDRNGTMWIGTSGEGVLRYQNGEISSLRQTNGLAHDFVTSLMEDREGSLWIGTREGLSQLSNVKFPIYSVTEGFASQFCHSLCSSTNGGFWVGTTTGVSSFDGKHVRNFSTEAGMATPYVKRVFEAKNGEVYLVNGNREVEVLAQGKIVARYPNAGWPTAIAEDAKGVVVSVGGNLFRVSRTEFVPYPYRDNAVPDLYWVRNLSGCADGSLLVASVNGVFRLKNGVAQHWSVEQGLSDYNVLWASEDKDGYIWAGLTTGISRIKDNQIRNITRENGLEDNNIRAIIPDDRGDIWMHSTRGILRVHRRSLNDFADGKIGKVECVLYDGLEAVKTIDTADVESDGCKSADGRIWFPSPQGAIMIDPAHLPINGIAPPVHIHQVRVNGKSFAGGSSVPVRPGNGDLEFEYTALSYIAPQKVQFRYQLQGYDHDWVDAGNRRSAFYTNLKPGRYTFHVQACNVDGIWNTTGDSLEVQLPPHFYQTKAFTFLALIFGVTSLFGVYGWRVKHLQNRQQRLQETNEMLESGIRERTRELAEQRNLLRTLIDHLPDNVFVKDTKSRIVLDNLSHSRFLGAEKPEAVVGKTDLDFFPPDLANKFYTDDQKVISSGEEFNGEESSSNSATGARRWWRTTKVPLRDSQGKIIGLAGINRDITESKLSEEKLTDLHKQLVDASRHAGMAEVATSVLHNVGNVLNSVNVSASVVEDKVRNSGTANLNKVLEMLNENKNNLGKFLTEDEKGKKFIPYLEALAAHLSEDRTAMLEETRRLIRNIEHIKEIVAMQQTYARPVGVLEAIQPAELAEDALRINAAAYKNDAIKVVREFSQVPAITTDRHKVIQILVNLLQNAKHACKEGGARVREVSVRIGAAGADRIKIEVTDNGIGIPSENLNRIFNHGFTTRKDGHGFGLHSGALAAKEMGGSLKVQSEGPQKGATFSLELPVRTDTRPSTSADNAKSPTTA
jgi:PAS domain S-box-containing protein